MSSLLNFSTQGVFIGSASPYSSSFESLATIPVQGVQTSTVTLTYPRQDEFDWAGVGDPVLIVPPRASLDFTYVFASGMNEVNAGFLAVPGISALANLNTERNYYVVTDQVNQDLVSYNGLNNVVLAFGNGVMTRYGLRASVGQPTVGTIGIDALNLLIQPSGSGQLLPSVYKQSGTYPTGVYNLPAFTQVVGSYFEAMPASIVLTLDSGCAIGALMSGHNACPLQSFEFSMSLPREEVKSIGWTYPDTRSIKWPIVIDIRAEALLNGYQLDALNRLGCPDSGWNFTVGFQNSCGTTDPFGFQFNLAKLDSQTFSAQIGGVNRVSLAWSLHIYDINRVSGANFFMTSAASAYNSIVFPQVSWGTGAGQSPLTINLGTYAYLSILNGAAILQGNNVLVSDAAGSATVLVSVSGTSESQQITVNVGS